MLGLTVLGWTSGVFDVVLSLTLWRGSVPVFGVPVFGVPVFGVPVFGFVSDFRRPGGDLLSHALRRSTIGAEGFHGRVRDGIGCRTLAITTRPAKIRARHQRSERRDQGPEWRAALPPGISDA